MGYHRAGFDVVGVDLEDRGFPFYRAAHDVTQLQMIPYGATVEVRAVGSFGQQVGRLGHFHAIHASPPCQAHTAMSNRWRGKGTKADAHVDLIAVTRAMLKTTGVPWVLENVPGAAKHLRDPITLTGGMFGLRVHRPRLFESNVLLLAPVKPAISRDTVGVFGKAHDGRLLWKRRDGSEQRAAASLEEARAAMGMPWADWRGCAEAVPPAYTEFIGRHLLRVVTRLAFGAQA